MVYLRAKIAAIFLLFATLLFRLNYGLNYEFDYGVDLDDECSDSPLDNNLKCQRYTSCEKCKDYVMNCQCDEQCHFYNDCCPDVSANNSTPRVPYTTFECVEVVISSNQLYLSIISSCPPTSAADDAKKCLDEGQMLVIGNDTSLTYKNKYCSECHGEKTFSYVDTFLSCSKNVSEASSYSEFEIYLQLSKTGAYEHDGMTCDLRYQRWENNHQCYPTVVRSCLSDSDPADVRACYEEPMNIVYELEHLTPYTKTPPYWNEGCAKCNNITQRKTSCKPPPYYNGGGGSPRPSKGFDSIIDLTKLYCLDEQFSLENPTTCDKPVCPHGKEYKPLYGCQLLTSPTNVTIECYKWINSTEYAVIDQDRITLREYGSLTYSRYIIENDTAYVCVDEVIHRSTNPTLSTVLVIISLVCLVTQMLCYVLFKKLRNTPNFIVACIISSLFVALVFYLTSSFVTPDINPQFCVAISVIQQLAFLAAFFWTNVMAFDITRMLSTTIRTQGKKKLIWYSLYAWGTPVALMIGALLADVNQASVRPVFGARECWFNDPIGLLVFFVGPLFLLLLFNVILYIIAVAAIVKIARQTKMVNPDLKERLVLCVRLIVVMGLPWVFAIPSAFSSNHVIDYIFTVLNSSQGLLIFLSFMFSDSVIKQLKARKSRYTSSYLSGRLTTSSYVSNTRRSNNSISWQQQRNELVPKSSGSC